MGLLLIEIAFVNELGRKSVPEFWMRKTGLLSSSDEYDLIFSVKLSLSETL